MIVDLVIMVAIGCSKLQRLFLVQTLHISIIECCGEDAAGTKVAVIAKISILGYHTKLYKVHKYLQRHTTRDSLFWRARPWIMARPRRSPFRLPVSPSPSCPSL